MSRPPLVRNIVTSTHGGELSSTSDLLIAKNHIMNSAFDFGQRSVAFASPTNPTNILDRWGVTFDGTTGTNVIGRSSFLLDTIPGFPQYYLGWDQTVAPTGDTLRVIHQHIESVRTLAGKTCTLSFWAAADTARTMHVNLRQNFGTGGSPSAQLDLPLQTIALTSIWQKFVVTFAVPTIAGKTIGSDGLNDTLELRFWLPINTIFNIQILQVMLNEGSTAGPWNYAGGTIGGELALCQRFFEKSAPLENAILTTGASGEFIVWPSTATFGSQFPARYKVRKRMDNHLAVAYSNVTGSANKVRNYTGGADDTANITGVTAYGYTGFSGTSVTANQQYGWQWYADAEY